MPYTAKLSGDNICTFDYYSMEDMRYSDFRCIYCDEKMHLRKSTIGNWFFAHNPRSSCWFSGIGVSEKHKSVCKFVYDKLKKDNPQAIVTVEKPFFKDGKLLRVADVCMEINGRFYVHEIQLSNMTPAEANQRDSDYKSCGVDCVTWWLGAKNQGGDTFDYCWDTWGVVLAPMFHQKEYTLSC